MDCHDTDTPTAEKKSSAKRDRFRVALVGKPNCGKSTLFNALTGLQQRTGNFPGVTVDKKTGRARLKGRRGTIEVEYVDLPGAYSIYPKSLDEEVTSAVLIDPDNSDHPDAVIIVADACNLKQCLFIASQVVDLGIPAVLALNMMDEAEKAGLVIHRTLLEDRLGIPAVEISAREKRGIADLQQALIDLSFGETPVKAHPTIKHENIASETISTLRKNFPGLSPFAVLQQAHRASKNGHDPEVKKILEQTKFNPALAQSEESLLRHAFIGETLRQCVSDAQHQLPPTTRRIDKVMLHPFWGYLIFLGVLFLIFQAIFFLAGYPMSWIEDSFEWIRTTGHSKLPAGLLTDLFLDGILAGLSGVVVFVPQIALLFLFIAVLEDTGYMARVSFIMDKLMRRFGLNGRSVIPLISGVACAVPAIMGARTISNRKERLITILITPLMSCSARLPVYTLLISLVVPSKMVLGIFNVQGLALMSLYLLGFVMALMTALVLKWVVRARERSFFIMELPVYRAPQWGTVLLAVLSKVKVFLLDAGKVIVAISVVLWMLASFGPGDAFKKVNTKLSETEQLLNANPPAAQTAQLKQQKNALEAQRLELSYAGLLGKTIEPAIRPLGFDWKIGISLITSLAAREVFVGTMATIYGAGGDDTQSIRERMAAERDPKTGQKVYSTATGFSLMIFYAFALQCMSTIAVVRRETGGWKWPTIQFVGFGALAWVMSFLAYQLLR